MVLVEWQQSAYKLDPPPICDIWIQQKLQYYIAHCIPELYTRADADGACSAGYMDLLHYNPHITEYSIGEQESI